MPGPAITDLFTPLTRSQVEDTILAICSALGLQATAWQPLGMARTIIATIAQKVADATALMAAMVRGGYLDYAEGGWLTLLARSVFGIDRASATFAPGVVTLTNASASVYGPFAVGAFHVANPTTGATYNNHTPFSSPATGSIDLDVVADLAGSVSSSGPSAVSALATPLIGVTSTNALPILGSDGQRDEDLRIACRAKLAAMSPGGAGDAYNFAAFEAATLEKITRATTIGDPVTGLVSTYLASASGPPTVGDVAIVQTAMNLLAEPAAVLSTAIAATTTTLLGGGARVWIQIQSGLDAAAAKNNVLTALALYLSTIPIGGIHLGGASPGVVPLEGLRATMMGANPKTLSAEIEITVADVPLLATDVPTLVASPTVEIIFQ